MRKFTIYNLQFTIFLAAAIFVMFTIPAKASAAPTATVSGPAGSVPGRASTFSVNASGNGVYRIDIYRTPTTYPSWTLMNTCYSSSCTVSWTPSSSATGDWYIVSNVYDANGQCSGNPFVSYPNGAWSDCSPGRAGTVVAYPPANPTIISASCPAPGTQASLSWNAASGASRYDLYVDNTTANGTGNNCTPGAPGDFCQRVYATSASFGSSSGAAYSWVLYACNDYSTLCSDSAATGSFTCTLPNCNTNLDCDLCSVPSNTCSTNNGSQVCYYRAYTGGGSCQVVSFSQSCTRSNCSSGYSCIGGTCTPPPPAPTNPVSSCPIPGTTASLSWTGSAGATRYDLYVRNTGLSEPTCGIGTVGGNFCEQVFGTSKSFTSSSGSNYSWNVYACNSVGCSSSSTGGTFTCTPAPTPPTPTISANPICTPTDTSSMYTISWSSVSPQVTYIDISDNNFTVADWWNKYVAGSTSTNTSTGFSGPRGSLTLQPNKTYYVRLWNGYIHSNTITFTTPNGCPPSAPTNPSASCPIPGTTGNMSWGGSSGASYYAVRLDNTGDAWTGSCSSAGGDYCKNVNNTSDSFGSIPGANYRFWVHACNSFGCSDPVGTSFSCTPAPTPPTPTVSSSPACTPTDTSSMYTISWASANPAVTYVDIDDHPFNQTADWYNKYVAGSTSVNVSTGFSGPRGSLTLQPNTTYYVRLWNGYGHSNTITFTTPGTCTCSGYTTIDTPTDNTTYTIGTNYSMAGWGTFCSGPNGTNRNRVDPYICDQGTWNNCRYIGPSSSYWRQDVVNAGWTCGNLNPNPDGWNFNWTPGSSFVGAKTLRVASINDSATTCVIWDAKNINVIFTPPSASITAPGNNSSATVGRAITISATANGDGLSQMIMYRSRTTIQSWTQVGATQSCGGASTCSISVTWTPSASDVGDWYFVVDVFGAGGQCSSNPFYLPNLPAPWISCGSTGYVGTTISLPNCDQGPGNCTGACTSTTACYETDPGNGTQGGCSFTTYSGGGSCTPIPTTQTKSCTLTPNCPPPDNYCNGGTCVALTTAATTACGSGTARSTGLVSTPQTGPNGQGTKFNTTGACAIDPAKIPFAPYKLPSYDDLKSLYFDQAKESITIKKQIDTGNMGEGGLSSYLSGGKNLIYIKGYLSMNNNIGGSNTAVVFIDGDLYFSSPMTQFTYGNAGSGIVFIVKGNVNIDQSVNRIDAVIISAGKIYTAGANCSHNPPLVTTNQLVINGSLVSLNENNTIEFCRTLANNSTAPAERINQQPKYLVILRNLYSDTIQKWSEIQ